MPSEHSHDLHARHVRVSVPEIDHVGERDALLVVRDGGVDELVVPGAEDALVDLEKVLGLAGVVHGDSRPDGFPLLVIDETAGEDVLEFSGYRAALDDFLEPG